MSQYKNVMIISHWLKKRIHNMPKRVHHNGKTAKCLFIVFLKVYSDVSIVNKLQSGHEVEGFNNHVPAS